MICSQFPENLKICIAEDEEGDRLLYTLAFEELKLSHRLMLFEDGDVLIKKLKEWAEKCFPGLVILDFNMPRKSGLETLKELKADIKLSRIPVVMFSTSVDSNDVLECYKEGLSGFFYKTHNYEQLLARIKILDEYFFKNVVLPPLENKEI